jgi:hypothetical protein
LFGAISAAVSQCPTPYRFILNDLTETPMKKNQKNYFATVVKQLSFPMNPKNSICTSAVTLKTDKQAR